MPRDSASSVRVERSQHDQTSYGEPFGWWGHHWTPPEPHSLPWLIERGSLDVRTAAFLSLAIEARASLIVVAEPHEAGKTTLLTALLDFLPEDVQPIYLRGWYERFAFLDTVLPEHAYLLCNEISAHLPTYLWGRGVRRVFEAGLSGYPVATTMHAVGAADALDQLASFPLNVPREHLAAINLVVTIGVGYASNKLLRRVSGIERVRPGRDGLLIDDLARREPLRAELDYQVGQYIGVLTELWNVNDSEAASMFARRTRQLEAWLAGGLSRAESIRDEVIAARRLDDRDPAGGTDKGAT